jgi:carboxyl-terminal processing protease
VLREKSRAPKRRSEKTGDRRQKTDSRRISARCAKAFPALGIALILASVPLYGQLTAAQKQLNVDSFETVWSTIRDKHWEKNPGGLDWQAVHDEFRPKIEKTETMEDVRAVMRQMLDRLHQSHFAILPLAIYQDIESREEGDGTPGFDVRALDGRAIVTEVAPGSVAAKAGVQAGWEVSSAAGKDLAPLIAQLKSVPDLHELALERAVMARVTGPPGAARRFIFLDGAKAPRTLDLPLAPPRGEMAPFGNLPPQHVWFESKKLGNTGYVRFNMFLDLVRVMPSFGTAVEACRRCDGMVIDLRGNPGGIGGMAMGMAGWLVDKPGQRLGTMYMRGATLNFVINPRADAFNGPLAVLVDGSSASTSEIFAGGLKDLGRARIFGTRTAAAALPSVITKLPNGDGFQYAIANYISQGGQPLEGNGVTPDVEVKLTREALLAGHDPVIDAALDWIQKRKGLK